MHECRIPKRKKKKTADPNGIFSLAVGSSVSGLSSLYTVAMKAAGASRRVFQLLDRVSSMPKSGNQCPLGLVY